MTVRLIHPWTGEIDYTYDYVGEPEVERALQSAAQAAPGWAARSLDERAGLMRAVAARLREQRDAIAAIMTADMGKLLGKRYKNGYSDAAAQARADKAPGQ